MTNLMRNMSAKQVCRIRETIPRVPRCGKVPLCALVAPTTIHTPYIQIGILFRATRQLYSHSQGSGLSFLSPRV
jgi:hypothetical protein